MSKFQNPIPTVDVVIFYEKSFEIVLIKRKNPPYGLALPGGFVNKGESLLEAVKREALEEVSIELEDVEQFYTYSDPKRDPRDHHMSTVFIANSSTYPLAGDDAADASVMDVFDALANEEFAFDHAKIIADVLKYKITGRRPT